MKSKSIKSLVLFLQLSLVGCIEPFNPPEIEQAASYLVMEGFLNIANQESTIKLSRTVSLSADTLVPETGAIVAVERERGGHYRFIEKGAGIYTYPPEFISESFQLRLMIQTKDGKMYYSDYVTPKTSPEIDSITYEVVQREEAAVQLNVNSSDPTGKTRFYRWELEETWEYTSAFETSYFLLGGELVSKNEEVYRCWKSNSPRNIMIGTTVKLNEDILRNNGIATLPISSNRFLVRYSALVKQYALSQEEYAYWTALAKTTENTGSIFDPLPSLVTGNMHCETDSKELIFGFFSAGAPKEKRVFLTPALGQYPFCYTYFLTSLEAKDRGYDIVGRGLDSLTYAAVPRSCVDCQLQGGTTTRPTFW